MGEIHAPVGGPDPQDGSYAPVSRCEPGDCGPEPPPFPFRITLDTEIEVAWQDTEGRKLVRVGMDFERLAAALLSMPNDSCVISLGNPGLELDGKCDERIVWCDGHGTARALHQGGKGRAR